MNDLSSIETYPVLTREVGSDSIGSGPRTGAGSALTRTVQATIRQVLGWRYRTGDSKGFTAALHAAAVRKEDPTDLTVSWEWRPAAFMVQADLGEVTGAQASLMQRTRVAVDQAKPILSRLAAIRPDANDEGIEGMRSLIGNHLEAIAEEIAQVGGPRVVRVDGLFWILLGGSTKANDKSFYRSLLGQFEHRLGYSDDRVNNIDQERGLTDLLVLRDIVLSLNNSWIRFRDQYMNKGFLGTSLVRFSRLLDVIVESVNEVYAAMDSVFFGEAERQAYLLQIRLEKNADTERLFGSALDTPEGKPHFEMTVADLLGWISSYAGSEARQHIQDAGKDGVVPVTFTLARMYHMLPVIRGEDHDRNAAGEAANKATKNVSNNILDTEQSCIDCHGLTHKRVQRALCELACYLRTAANIGVVRYIAEPMVAEESFHLDYLNNPVGNETLQLDRLKTGINETAKMVKVTPALERPDITPYLIKMPIFKTAVLSKSSGANGTKRNRDTNKNTDLASNSSVTDNTKSNENKTPAKNTGTPKNTPPSAQS